VKKLDDRQLLTVTSAFNCFFLILLVYSSQRVSEE